MQRRISMERKLSSHTVPIGFISLVLFLALTTFAQAQVEIWTGPVHFTVKITTDQKNAAGNHVFVTSSETFEGTMNFYWDTSTNHPTLGGPNNCFIELLGNDGTDLCFNDGFYARSDTQTKTGYKMTPLLVGIGTFNNIGNGNTGFVYISGKDSWMLDLSKNPTSIKLGGKAGGGFSDSNGKAYIFSATLPATILTLAH